MSGSGPAGQLTTPENRFLRHFAGASCSADRTPTLPPHALPPPAEGDALAAVLGAEAAAADWARKPGTGGAGVADGSAIATLGGRPAKRQKGDHEWAIK